MRWQGRRRSTNVEHRRGSQGGSRRAGIPISGKSGGISIVGLLVIIGLSLAFGVDPMTLLGDQPGSSSVTSAPTGKLTPQEEQSREFVEVILADTEDTWRRIFRSEGLTYNDPGLVTFVGAVHSACGTQRSAVGPFYCPGDNKIYMDLSFFDELSTRFGAPGDFAQAYVLAHEVGHHVQNLLDISDKVQKVRSKVNKAEGNVLSVRLELQADCLAGVWGHHAGEARQLLERGDIEEGLRAATAIGDDHLQKQARGYTTPESFTHGTSEQRVKWFKRGLQSGDWNACDTFNAQSL